MKRVLVVCDGADLPAGIQNEKWDATERLSHRGPSANLNLRIETPEHALLSHVDARGADLFRIAAYAYGADQMVRRGGDADVYGDSWNRDFTLLIPVNDPDFWTSEEVLQPLRESLHFASGDRWDFYFLPAAKQVQQVPFDIDPNATLGDPDSAFLLSGGLDSLCAVVEAIAADNARPLLIGHSPALHIGARQRNITRLLRERWSESWSFPYISVAIHRRSSDPREYTQRTRPFLYGTIGAVIADRLGLTEVSIPDNGVVSLNLPINDQLVGTKASRSTHPKFLRLFNDLSDVVLANRPHLVNPLWARTRAQGLEALRRAGAVHLLEETNSCSHPRNLTRARPHCGTCSQCIDRRFATLAAGMEEYDLGERYDTDIFCDALPEGPERTMAVSYYRFALGAAEVRGPEAFDLYPELWECVNPDDPHQRETAEQLVNLLQRHGRAVVRVMAEQIVRCGDALARRQIPPTSLIRLVAASDEVDRPTQEGFEHSPDYSWVRLRDLEFTLGKAQATVAQILDHGRLNRNPDISWEGIATELDTSPDSMSDVFKNVPNWKQLIVSKRRGLYRLNI